MTRELSKKLCEIVGIEPKNSSCCSCEYFDIESGFCSYEVDEDGYGCNQLYPDFGQPENFVKLLEIYFQHNLLSDVGSIEDILKRIINSAELNCGLKRIIREAEWKYE